jgi:acetylornithine deacetylase/succinyl-diaminopimelate desuccinylase-like protein
MVSESRKTELSGPEPHMFRSRALDYAQAHGARFVRQLQEFVGFPTVSSQPRHAADVRHCAAWLAQHLRGIGLDSPSVTRSAEL